MLQKILRHLCFGNKQKEQDWLEKMATSKKLLTDAATSTMNLASDVTSQLKDRIEDYTAQIEKTSTILSDALMVISQNGKIESFNPAAEKIFGYDQSIIGKDFSQLFHTINIKNEFNTLIDIFNDPNCPNVADIMGITATGKKLNVNVSISQLNKKDGTSHYIIVVRDVTDLVAAKDALAESQEHFKMFSDASCEAMLVHDNNHILDWNARLLEMTGYSVEDIQHCNPNVFFHPLERESFFNKMESVNQGSGCECMVVRKDGVILETLVTFKPIEWHDQPCKILLIRDVSNLKDIENQLKTIRQRYSTITDNTIDLVFCFDRNLHVTYANTTFWDYFGFEIKSMKLNDLLPIEDHTNINEIIKKFDDQTHVQRVLTRILHHGEIRWQDWIIKIVKSDSGIVEYHVVARDITHYV